MMSRNALVPLKKSVFLSEQAKHIFRMFHCILQSVHFERGPAQRGQEGHETLLGIECIHQVEATLKHEYTCRFQPYARTQTLTSAMCVVSA